LLGEAFARLLEVPQPLRDYFSATYWRQAEQIARGEKARVSISSCYFSGD
jgi:hypothetical protein